MIELVTKDQIFPYWKTANVSKRIDAISSFFTLDLTNTKGNLEELTLDSDQKVALKLYGKQIVSGYIDTMEPGFSKDGCIVSIAGRDNTGDLVDCSVDLNQSEFNGLNLRQIAEQLCAPVDIAVRSDFSGQAVPSFKIDPGESIFEALERASKLWGVLFRPDGLGNLEIQKIGNKYASTPLIEGLNMQPSSASYDSSERFSDYTVIGQDMAPPPGGKNSEQIFGRAKDKGVRFRPKIIIAGSSLTQSQATALAEWEATVRAARALTVTVETNGWVQADGSLWDVNELIKVKSPRLGIDAYMLSSGVDFSYAEKEGAKAAIELTRLDAFKPKPVVEGL